MADQRVPTQMTSKFYSFYLGYPCSVDAGIDPVRYTEMIITRIKCLDEEGRDDQAQQLRKELCELIPTCDVASNDVELINNAEKLKESWGYAVSEDTTMMGFDTDLVAECSQKMGFSKHVVNTFLKVIDEFQNERIENVQGFLSCIPTPQNDAMRLLYLCGHGLSEEDAAILCANQANNNGKSSVWPWELCSCWKTMGRLPSDVTSQAKKGDIVVFSSGLLTPEWVVEKLRKCEENLKSQVQNTIVIVIDSCYSGAWNTRMQQCLSAEPLQCTRVILQTSCGENEVSYGKCFTPVFCALQDSQMHAKLTQLYEEDKDAMEGIGLLYEQTPSLYKHIPNNDLELPASFNFIHDLEFFKFCTRYLTIQSLDASRGIPGKEFSEFFRSFSSNSSNQPYILCFRLNCMKKNDSPLAFFLIEWKGKKYHIHLHFDDLKKMNLTGITHVDVVDGYGIEYRYDEDPRDKKKKKRITQADQTAWYKHVEPNKVALVTYFQDYAEKHLPKKWNEVSWNMEKALPENYIRSRSAHFKEVKEKYMLMKEFK